MMDSYISELDKMDGYFKKKLDEGYVENNFSNLHRKPIFPKQCVEHSGFHAGV